jgi:hypothetical protein
LPHKDSNLGGFVDLQGLHGGCVMNVSFFECGMGGKGGKGRVMMLPKSQCLVTVAH